MKPSSFSHENLHVYQLSLAFCDRIREPLNSWHRRHDVLNHFRRASDSIVENIAEASAAYSGYKQLALDVAMGSVLECAACVDVAFLKALQEQSELKGYKLDLLQIFKMLIGLRKSWNGHGVREPDPEYDTSKANDRMSVGFHHERLDVYKRALDVVHWMVDIHAFERLPAHVFRKLDSLSTAIVLNIAEGNGRYSNLDQARFLENAHRSAIKMSAQLDLCRQRNLVSGSDVQANKDLLLEIVRMTGRMIASLRLDSCD